MLNQARITIFYGNGKGKSSAALGTIMRASGADLKILTVFFMKGTDFPHSETVMLNKNKNIDFMYFGCTGWLMNNTDIEKHKIEAKKAIEYVTNQIENNKYGLIVLDEILNCIKYSLLEESDVIELIGKIKYNIEVILTGREVSNDLLSIADVVTNMDCVKHDYNNGVTAKIGIDY